MNCKLALVFAVLAFVALAEAQRGGGRGGRRGPPRRGGGDQTELRTPPEGDRYKWTRQLDADTSVREGAFVPTDKQLVTVFSGDRALRDAGYNRSTTFYDFSTSPPVAVLSLGPVCFVIDTSLTYAGMVSDLASRNDTEVTAALTVVTLDGTAEPLATVDAESLLTSNPALSRPCRGPIVNTVTTPASTDSPTEELNLITFDSNIKLTVPERPAGRRPRPGQGLSAGSFGGPGGRGRGGRGGRRG